MKFRKLAELSVLFVIVGNTSVYGDSNNCGNDTSKNIIVNKIINELNEGSLQTLHDRLDLQSMLSAIYSNRLPEVPKELLDFSLTMIKTRTGSLTGEDISLAIVQLDEHAPTSGKTINALRQAHANVSGKTKFNLITLNPAQAILSRKLDGSLPQYFALDIYCQELKKWLITDIYHYDSDLYETAVVSSLIHLPMSLQTNHPKGLGGTFGGRRLTRKELFLALRKSIRGDPEHYLHAYLKRMNGLKGHRVFGMLAYQFARITTDDKLYHEIMQELDFRLSDRFGYLLAEYHASIGDYQKAINYVETFEKKHHIQDPFLQDWKNKLREKISQ